MSKFLVLSLSLFMAIIIMGCSRSESPTGPSVPATGSNPPGVSRLPDQLRGYWMLQSVKINGTEKPFVEALHRDQRTEVEVLGLVGVDEFYRMDYDTNATAVYYESGVTVTTSQQLVLMALKANGQALNPSNTIFSSWTVQADTLTLSTDVDGSPLRIAYTRFDFYSSPYF